MRCEPFHLHIHSIIERELSLKKDHLQILGCNSVVGLGTILSHSQSKLLNQLPNLIIVPTTADALRLEQSLRFFGVSSNIEICPHYDVSPYLGLQPRNQNIYGRIRFLHRLNHGNLNDIFIIPVGSLLQKTIPYNELKKNSYRLSKGQDLPIDFEKLLLHLGYVSSPYVEDVGQFAIRGGVIDLYSPIHDHPLRLELFGDTIESIRFFSSVDQRSTFDSDEFWLTPVREIIFNDESADSVILSFRNSIKDRPVDTAESEDIIRSLSRQTPFQGMDFLISDFYKNPAHIFDHLNSDYNIWLFDQIEIKRHSDQILETLKNEFSLSSNQCIRPLVDDFIFDYEKTPWPTQSRKFQISTIEMLDADDEKNYTKIHFPTHSVHDFNSILAATHPGTDLWNTTVQKKFQEWKQNGFVIFISIKNKSQSDRLKLLFEKINIDIQILDSSNRTWNDWFHLQKQNLNTVHVLLDVISESLKIPDEHLIFLQEEDLLGKKIRSKSTSSSDDFQKAAKRLNFGDLKPGDCVVHIQHGIGIYEGLKIMPINGIESEFIQISYKDKDKLYLPVYRVSQLQKYSGLSSSTVLDKLGGPGWEKVKTKVKKHLKDIANELLDLYARRSEITREPFKLNSTDVAAFESSFPYDETDDQIRAINDFTKDMTSVKPMDRLVCGDVGFGKTEIAMRAAFLAAINRKQVAVLAPTTVLSFQHLETFKKRFSGWPINIRALNRFVPANEVKKTLEEIKNGQADIVIGTHRLISKDIQFKDLGLLIVDEEQKFGVAHKEKIRKMRVNVDTLTMSATPIPRTLNMSFVGIRDLSLINTAPVDRLPTRTLICKFDPETIRKAIQSEMSRGGQIYFIHNRVQSIYALADELKQIVPQARIRVGHGQMEEDELEKTMVAFFNHEIDILVCTTIVESGMDVSRANTMFIDQAHMLGLSQLYQLRGRVGRSKQRAYCYLIVPKGKQLDKDAQERLRVIQENTALGSGVRIAQYDLELRGAGSLLGEEQSGHVDSVGYELYMDLLNQTIAEVKGDDSSEFELDPEINLRIPALIPDNYMKDVRIRLSYYKALADIQSESDLEKLEEEIKDQFGPLPDPVLNLMGLMLIRSQCKKLGVRDISAGPKNVSLIFTEKTKIKPETVIKLAMRENKKYSVTPDSRLNIRINNITWPSVYEELKYLLTLV